MIRKVSKIVQFLHFIEERDPSLEKFVTNNVFLWPRNDEFRFRSARQAYIPRGNFSRVIIVWKGNGIYEMESGRTIRGGRRGRKCENDRATPLSPAPWTFLEGPEEFAECRCRSSFSLCGCERRVPYPRHSRNFLKQKN